MEKIARLETLVAEHHRLDEVFGRFLAALGAWDATAARAAMEEFDLGLRRHMEAEERPTLPSQAGRRLDSAPDEHSRRSLSREPGFDRVRVREVSGMIRRLLEVHGDLVGAVRLTPGLARRWDAHTVREEKNAFPA